MQNCWQLQRSHAEVEYHLQGIHITQKKQDPELSAGNANHETPAIEDN